MYADGMPLREIEREFGIDRKVIREWKRRFEEDGMDGLEKRHYRCTDMRPGVRLSGIIWRMVRLILP